MVLPSYPRSALPAAGHRGGLLHGGQLQQLLAPADADPLGPEPGQLLLALYICIHKQTLYLDLCVLFFTFESWAQTSLSFLLNPSYPGGQVLAAQ